MLGEIKTTEEDSLTGQAETNKELEGKRNPYNGILPLLDGDGKIVNEAAEKAKKNCIWKGAR